MDEEKMHAIECRLCQTKCPSLAELSLHFINCHPNDNFCEVGAEEEVIAEEPINRNALYFLLVVVGILFQ